MNKGLEKVGEGFIQLANLLLVLFLLNTYLQTQGYSIGIAFIIFYGILNFYHFGYLLINRANRKDI